MASRLLLRRLAPAPALPPRGHGARRGPLGRRLRAAAGQAHPDGGGLADDLDFVYEPVPSSPSTAGPAAGPGPAPGPGSAAAVALQAHLVGARGVRRVLELVGEHLEEMDALHAATALHRLARHSPRGAREAAALAGEPRRAALLERLGRPGTLEGLSVQGRCCALWALARLRAAPPWLPRLLELAASDATSFSPHQLATVLYALTRLEGASATQAPQDLLEALHTELRRRQGSLGSGGTSAMDTVLILDSLARLQLKDDELCAALADAIRSHLAAGDLGFRQVRHTVSALAPLGFCDAQLFSSLCEWLVKHMRSCSTSDLTVIAFGLTRVAGAASDAHRRFCGALAPEVRRRLDEGELGSREASRFFFVFSQAALLDGELAGRLAETVQLGPEALNGQDLAVMLPCLGPAAGTHPELLQRLAADTARCAGTLSPRQLARLMCGFGDARVRAPFLWDSLASESLARASSFAAPDVLRALAGMGAAGVERPRLQRALWKIVAGKSGKFLVEELLALLQLWPNAGRDVRKELPGVPGDLLLHLRQRVERGGRGGWQAPPELAAELIEWLPESRSLGPRNELDVKLVTAIFAQLPAQLRKASLGTWERLSAALALPDAQLLGTARGELERQHGLGHAVGQLVARASSRYMERSSDPAAAAAMAFRCAALGFDGPPLRELLRALFPAIDRGPGEIDLGSAALLCWACAEVRSQRKGVLRLASRARERRPAGADAVSGLRLAWASLASEAPESEVRALLGDLSQADAAELLAGLTAADARPVQQLAWHGQQQQGAAAGNWTEVVLAQAASAAPGASRRTAFDNRAAQELSSLLQHMRVPHVVASVAAVPGGIYQVPIWFPEPQAVVDVDAGGDRLSSGALGGAAELRRRQLREAGLKVHAVESAALRVRSKRGRLKALAEAIRGSCPEAAAWLASAEATMPEEAPEGADADAPTGTAGTP